ncbi:LysR family transcriptional regulator [Pseudorhodoferax sp. Leaf267]|nr:LysR family transcriptional regulator [Pseudorhodoferax sp. Leaf267]KQP21628.1 LysR family transcriptional regulator [Pseudorhodoferax sp. Leaf267]
MNVERIDLNLLRVFDAVFEERNLLRAGHRLHLSQSAVSHALARLREALDDELFVRTSRGMEPTARALAMAPGLRQSLQRIHQTLGAPRFDAAHSARRFVVAANDHLTAVLVARMSRAIAVSAPHIDVVVRPSTRIDLAEQIDVGRIDLAIGIFSEVPQRFGAMALGQHDEVIVMRRGHPIGRRRARLADLAAYPLLTVSLGGQEEGAISGFIVERGLARQSEMFDRHALEQALARESLLPRYRVTVAHALAIPMLLRETDMLSIVPRPLAGEFVQGAPVACAELPYTTPGMAVRAVWHQRNEDDAGHQWLRAEVAQAAAAVAALQR